MCVCVCVFKVVEAVFKNAVFVGFTERIPLLLALVNEVLCAGASAVFFVMVFLFSARRGCNFFNLHSQLLYFSLLLIAVDFKKALEDQRRVWSTIKLQLCAVAPVAECQSL